MVGTTGWRASGIAARLGSVAPVCTDVGATLHTSLNLCSLPSNNDCVEEYAGNTPSL